MEESNRQGTKDHGKLLPVNMQSLIEKAVFGTLVC